MSILKVKIVNYLSFDGSNDYVDLGTPTLDIDTAYSLTAKVNTLASGDFQSIIIADESNIKRLWQFRFDSDGTIRFIRFNSSDNVVANFNTSQSYNTGQDIWVTATFSTTNGSRIYVNGSLVATDGNTTANNSGSTQTQLRIGNYYRVSLNDLYHFNGNIYNVQIWEKELTSTEINNYISNLPTGNETDLFGYYDFQDGSGSTLGDSAGTNDGTIVGATWNSETVTPAIDNIYYGVNTIDRVYAGSSIVYPAFVPITATGGSISNVNISGVNYRIHAFTNVGTSTFTVIDKGTTTADILIVAGGGGGGGRHGGGGGGGGVLYGSLNLANQDYTVVVGDGGSFNQVASDEQTLGDNGENSSFNGIIALGGGGGGSTTSSIGGRDGGSGGGGGGTGDLDGTSPGIATQTSTNGLTGYGNNGGQGTSGNQGAGGGGAGQAGSNSVSSTIGGNGGDGIYFGNVFTDNYGENGYFAGGGGGSSDPIASDNPGGIGGGGDGDGGNNNGHNGLPNTGGGGGGTRSDNTTLTGGIGGSGIVLIRYRLDPPS